MANVVLILGKFNHGRLFLINHYYAQVESQIDSFHDYSVSKWPRRQRRYFLFSAPLTSSFSFEHLPR